MDWGDVAKDATWGAVFGPLGKKIGKLIPDGAGQYTIATFCSIILHYLNCLRRILPV